MFERSAVALLVGSGSIAGAFSKWILVWLFSRSGGPDAVGMYSLILAIATPIFVVSQLGLRTIFLSSPTPLPWRTFVMLRCVGNSVASGLVILAALTFMSAPAPLVAAVLLLKVADSLLDILFARMQYDNRLVRMSVVVLLNAMASVLFAVLMFAWFGDPVLSVWAAGLTAAIVVLLAYVLARRVPYASEVRAAGARTILRFSGPVALSQLLASLLFQLPILLLSFVGLWSEIGIYASAAYLLVAANILGATLQTVLISPFRRARQNVGAAAVLVRVRRVVLVSFLGILPAAAIVIGYGEVALRVIYGHEFVLGRGAIALLALAAAMTIVSAPLNVALNVFGEYTAVTKSMALSAGVSLATGFALSAVGISGLVIAASMAASGASARVLFMAVSVWRSKARS